MKIQTKNLSSEARNYIDSVVKYITDNKTKEDVDLAALEMLAINYDMFLRASRLVLEDGLTVISDRGNLTPHPLIKVAKDALLAAVKIMTEFGLTAKSRGKIAPLEEKEISPLEQFILEGKEVR